MKLSIVLSTFNEEKNMEEFFENVGDIADEVVLVDGSSKDKTVEIAKKYGAKIKITDNPPIFLINRQKAIDMADDGWLLNLDADERLSPELKKEIRAIIKEQETKSKEQISGYWIPRKNLFLGRFLMKGGQYPDYQLRLYRKDKVHFKLQDVHEQAIVDGQTAYLKSAMLHYPYFNFSHYLKKWNVYNKALADQISEEQRTKNIFQKFFYAFMYLFIRPGHWLFTTYFRHKGFMDGWQGFVFSFFSALRFPIAYFKAII
jgi:glycosyltransferase involved in cell wall biosynthesis